MTGTGDHTGDWLYSHQDLELLRTIEEKGWEPEQNTGSKYGCGVYLARGWWHSDAAEALRCQLRLKPSEVISIFDAVPGFEQHGTGRTEGHLARYLQHEGVLSTNRPPTNRGDHPNNTAIRDHFLKLGTKVVLFQEHGHEVCVVFDTGCIEIVKLIKRDLPGGDIS